VKRLLLLFFDTVLGLKRLKAGLGVVVVAAAWVLGLL